MEVSVVNLYDKFLGRVDGLSEGLEPRELTQPLLCKVHISTPSDCSETMATVPNHNHNHNIGSNSYPGEMYETGMCVNV